MPIQPNGTYQRQMNALAGSDLWQQRAAQANPIISASEHDAEMNDVATAITGCLKANGTTTATANLPMGGHKLTGCANAVADDELTTLGQIKSGTTLTNLAITDNSGGNALTVTQNGGGTAITTSGVAVMAANSANPTLTVTQSGAGTVIDANTGLSKIGRSSFSDGDIELNANGTGDRSTYIDFHAQDSVDYNARIIRNSGANGSLVISNTGTGGVSLTGGSTGTTTVGGLSTQTDIIGSVATVIALTGNATLGCSSSGEAKLGAGTRVYSLSQATGLEIASSDGTQGGFIKTDEGAGQYNGLVFYANRGSGNITFRTNDAGETDQVEITSAGNLIVHADIRANENNVSDIGTATLRFGTIYYTALNAPSDIRLKADVTDLNVGLSFIRSLRPVSYRMIESHRERGRDENGDIIYTSIPGTRPHWGLISQEVKQAIDAAGTDFAGWQLADKNDPDSLQSLSYSELIAPLIQAIKELSSKVESLEAEVASLKAS